MVHGLPVSSSSRQALQHLKNEQIPQDAFGMLWRRLYHQSTECNPLLSSDKNNLTSNLLGKDSFSSGRGPIALSSEVQLPLTDRSKCMRGH